MGLFKKGNKVFGIWNYKCPRCHEGDLFPTPFRFETAFKMHDDCSHCQQTYMPEPGFYYGAMFISYIWTGFFCLGFIALMIFGFGWSIDGSFVLLTFVLVLMFVTVFRLSRSIWLGLMVKYDAEKAVKK